MTLLADRHHTTELARLLVPRPEPGNYMVVISKKCPISIKNLEVFNV